MSDCMEAVRLKCRADEAQRKTFTKDKLIARCVCVCVSLSMSLSDLVCVRSMAQRQTVA